MNYGAVCLSEVYQNVHIIKGSGSFESSNENWIIKGDAWEKQGIQEAIEKHKEKTLRNSEISGKPWRGIEMACQKPWNWSLNQV